MFFRPKKKDPIMLKFLTDPEQRKQVQEYVEVTLAVATIVGFATKRIKKVKVSK